ncbi:DNA cytosine methyltransferase, partial [Deltaproteobacteria bacterium TL4]
MSSDFISVIDLFAGPGGLGEGFSSYSCHDDRAGFKIALSIEKDVNAHRTLELRAFFRQFEYSDVPRSYYAHLRGEISRDELFETYPLQADSAKAKAWNAELGVTDTKEIDRRVTEALGVNHVRDRWVLIGGPPCQAYSVVGRSRNAKVWKEYPERRDSDPRHFLYKEYLRILAEHHPPVFIMENVKGMLSSL